MYYILDKHERKEIKDDALKLLNNGYSVDHLVHLLFDPRGQYWNLSTPLNLGESLTGLTETYYTLGFLSAKG